MLALSHGVFDYRDAMSRNIGWITEWEQQALRGKTVAIAGMGGVGGVHLLTLARLGIGGFSIADYDCFETANFNRQAGAGMVTIGSPKAETMAGMARDINPGLRLAVFPDGVDGGNLDAFLAGADLFVDGLDFFAVDIRRKVFARCKALGIPALTAAPIGMGTAYLVFLPGGMSFEDYFRLDGLPEERQYVNFAVGLAPKGFHRSYLVDPSRVDLAGRRGPSTAAAVQLCAGVVGAQAVKILLGRGTVRAAPCYHQFDAYRDRWKRGWLPLGNRNPLQALKRHIGYRAFARFSRNARPVETPATGSEIARILDLARWAPSGDNAQPWRFEIIADDRVMVHVRVEGEAGNVYDYNNGQPTLLSAGFLLETMRIAASGFGRGLRWDYLGSDGPEHRIEAAFPKDAAIAEDALYPYIPIRSVDRRRYRVTPLAAAEKAALERALGDDLTIRWQVSLGARWRMARLNARATDIRLRIREAWEVHRRILDWERRFSPDGVPVTAVGLDPLTLKIMRWATGEWRRLDVMNRFFAATVLPRLQLDILPGVLCAAHFTVAAGAPPEGGPEGGKDIIGLLRAGQALQRFWLTATRMGLVVQPALAPLCFAHYGRRDDAFTEQAGVRVRAARLADAVAALHGSDPGGLLFTGRIGRPVAAAQGSRSVRREVRAPALPSGKREPL